MIAVRQEITAHNYSPLLKTVCGQHLDSRRIVKMFDAGGFPVFQPSGYKEMQYLGCVDWVWMSVWKWKVVKGKEVPGVVVERLACRCPSLPGLRLDRRY